MLSGQPLKILTSGGSLSQLCALGTGLYIKKIYGRDFILSYLDSYMDHTDGFMLSPLLSSDQYEIRGTSVPSIISGRITKYIPKNLLFLFKIPIFLWGILMRFSFLFQRTRTNRRARHLALTHFGDLRTLDRISSKTLTISGNYWPGLINEVWAEMYDLFDKSALPNIFSAAETLRNQISIHLRLGDMRTDSSSRATHGVIDPYHFISLVQEYNSKRLINLTVTVYSDEPKIAKLLFDSYGIKNWNFSPKGVVWEDIGKMVSSEYFIGSYSTVSMVVAAIRFGSSGLKSTLPQNSRKNKIRRKQVGCQYFRARFLDESHWVYNLP